MRSFISNLLRDKRAPARSAGAQVDAVDRERELAAAEALCIESVRVGGQRGC
jgi:hypothetical protein